MTNFWFQIKDYPNFKSEIFSKQEKIDVCSKVLIIIIINVSNIVQKYQMISPNKELCCVYSYKMNKLLLRNLIYFFLYWVLVVLYTINFYKIVLMSLI